MQIAKENLFQLLNANFLERQKLTKYVNWMLCVAVIKGIRVTGDGKGEACGTWHVANNKQSAQDQLTKNGACRLKSNLSLTFAK